MTAVSCVTWRIIRKKQIKPFIPDRVVVATSPFPPTRDLIRLEFCISGEVDCLVSSLALSTTVQSCETLFTVYAACAALRYLII